MPTFALEYIKIKATQEGNIIKVKTMIRNPMLSPYQAEKKTGDRNKANFIRHIFAYVGNKIVYDISTSPYLKKTPIFRFKYNYKNRGNQLQLIFTDNKGKQVSSSIKIAHSLSKNFSLHSKNTNDIPIDYWIKFPKIWEITTTKEVIRKLYGSNEIEDNGINCKVSNSDYTTHINITSGLALESIAILSNDTRTYNNIIPALRAIILVPKNTLVDYSLDIVVSGNCCENVPITIIAKGEDGQLYRSVQQGIQGCSDCAMNEA